MKKSKWLVIGLAAAMVATTGCAKSKPGPVNTAQLEQTFQSAEPTLRSSVDKAIAAIKSADYADALAELQKLANEAKLTAEQQQAVKDLIAQVQKAIEGVAGKAAGEAGKAVEQIQQKLPK